MDKEIMDVLDYLKETPANTNPSVLNGLLNKVKASGASDLTDYPTKEEVQELVDSYIDPEELNAAVQDLVAKTDLGEYAKKSETVGKSTYDHEMEIMNGKLQTMSSIEMDLDSRVDTLENDIIPELQAGVYEAVSVRTDLDYAYWEIFDSQGYSIIARNEGRIEELENQIESLEQEIEDLREALNDLRPED